MQIKSLWNFFMYNESRLLAKLRINEAKKVTMLSVETLIEKAKSKGVTQKELARLMDTSQSMISAYKSGVEMPHSRYIRLVEIVDALYMDSGKTVEDEIREAMPFANDDLVRQMKEIFLRHATKIK